MKLSPAFDTSIDQLLVLKNQNTQFLSTWDKGYGHLDFPDTIIWPALKEYPELKNDYFFSDEFMDLKYDLMNGGGIPILENNTNNFGVFSNGTSAAMLALMSIKEIVSSIRSILISPTYFTYIKCLQDFDSDIYFLPIELHDNILSISLNTIKREIVLNKINLIVLTVPLFGLGLSPEKETIKKLCQICMDSNCYLLIDGLYGGMDWFKHNTIATEWFWALSLEYDKVIFIESLSKRVFLNGIKSAIVCSSANFIHHMELKSVHLTGSLSYSQVAILKHLYSKENIPVVESTINKNKEFFQLNYQLLQAICLNTKIHILPCTEGYFCLAQIPIKFDENSLDIAIRILKETNVMTIPHDRYLYFTHMKYTFRINLSIKKEKLFDAMKKLLQVNF